MTQEEKQLLLIDLCARLPYGVKVLYWHHKNGGAERRVGELANVDLRLNCDELVFRINQYYFESDSIATSKPYLRPLSSMTEKEQRYIWDKYGHSFLVADFEDAGDVSELFNYCQMNISRAPSFVDWLNEHHFDYRGLIEKGLALEAPKGMYKIE